MKNYASKLLATAMGLGAALLSLPAIPDDIDLFANVTTAAASNPNVLIILDNTANWSRQDQHFPGGITQGQAEVQAIQTAISALGANVNVGLMEFVTKQDDGGQIAFAVQPMNAANQSSFTNILTNGGSAIYNNITNPSYKLASGVGYGDIMYDAYNYFKGNTPFAQSADVVTSRADSNGYVSNYTQFKAPPGGSCGHNYIIFIGNPNAQGPITDSTANTTALSSLGGSTTQPPVAQFAVGNIATNLGFAGQCYTPDAAGASSCSSTEPAGTYTAQCNSTSGSYNSCACDSTSANGTSGLTACPSGLRYSVFGTTSTTTTSTVSGPTTTTGADAGMTACLAPAPALGTSETCPTTTSSTATGPGANQTTTTTTSWASCATSGTTGTKGTCGTTGNGNNKVQTYTYPISGSKTVTVTQNTTTSSSSNLGNTLQCYASLGACSTSDYSGSNLSCNTPTTTTGTCPNGGVRYQVQGINQGETPTGTNSVLSPLPLNANLWAQFMAQNGIANTYSIDVYNAAPNNVQSALLNSMATLGSGKYFSATNAQAIASALAKIFQEIQSVNSAFASSSLPVNATNRAQNVNQVFVGMFRPDPHQNPRWFGNLKRYQLIVGPSGSIDLGDVNGNEAINNQSGFIDDCASSFWSSDSGSYWQNVIGDSPSPKGKCTSSAFNAFSDAPDGPIVEKGATAEVVRLGNNPPTTTSSPTYLVNRTVLTQSGSSLVPFSTASVPTLPASLISFMQGNNNDSEFTANYPLANNTVAVRPSIHGDVIHSRPLPVNYGGTPNNIVGVYGSNDGTLRAINATNGQELWAFIAPEFFSRLNRLMANSPPVLLFGGSTTSTPTPTPKDYFFDGSIGLYQTAGSGKVWIYPSMRRGGRMLYALDVTSSSSPTFKWKAGCPNLTDDTGCTSDANGVSMSGIGQTWSLPNVAPIKGYSTGGATPTYPPVVIMGGGYDGCEDANTSAPSCASTKGKVVYVLDANDGHVVASFPTTRGVVADVSLVDVDSDGRVDYAYAADTGGNIYRISFVDSAGLPLAPASWKINRVAYTSGSGRKFLFGPAVLPAKGGYVYLALGSGDREHPLSSQYPYPGAVTTAGVVNRFYEYLDNLADTNTTNTDLATVTDLDNSTAMQNSTAASCNTAQVLPGGTLKGWYMNLNQYGPGEQTVTSAVIAGGLVTFSTNRPTAPVANACSSLGEARGYLVNLFNGSGAIGVSGNCGGSNSGTFVGGGLPPSPVIATVPVGSTVHTVLIGAVQKSGGVNTTTQSQDFSPVIAQPRRGVYWKKKGDN